MADKKNTWANQQIIWGWVFLISVTLFLLYLLLTFLLPHASDARAPFFAVERTPPSSMVIEGAMPPVKATALAEAQATLSVADQQPVQAASSVREAAQTVLAVTAESFQTPAVDATKVASISGESGEASDESDGGEESTPSGLRWVDWVLSAIPGLTAILSFIGLVFSSIMKWRSDLQDVGHDSVGYERERLQFEMQKQRFELDRAHQEALLAQQRQELALERERLELALMRQKARLEAASDAEEPRDEPNALALETT